MPIVVGPPPWVVLIVLLALVKCAVGVEHGLLADHDQAVGRVADRAEQVLARGQRVEVELDAPPRGDAEAGEGDAGRRDSVVTGFAMRLELERSRPSRW